MSLYAIIQLFVERRRQFVSAFLAVILVVLVVAVLQPERYRSELMLSLTRTALPTTTEYAYDHFYRFQADERLAESIVQYLGSATGRRAIAERAGLEGVAFDQFTEEKLRIARRSTNLVAVEYDTVDRARADRLGEAIEEAANAYLVSLNEDARETSWFTIIGDEPAVRVLMLSPTRWALIALVGGLLVGFWTVLLQHFWEGYRGYRKQSER